MQNNDFQPGTLITVNDSLQSYRYIITAKLGQDFAADFRPDLTPQQMLALGVFGGNYFQNEFQEFPREWFVNAKTSTQHDPLVNYFGIDAGQNWEQWRKKGWLYEEDPRGWFQWYCRYYIGRRIPQEDARQIKRWQQMKRHVFQLMNQCQPGDMLCQPRRRQALLHWAYDSRVL